ncbi:peptidase M28-like protein [Chitinophaga niastensis]|uniref:Peptidase M28-like protein n=1 Tax=Chitinophaga niastensis TaxID=536980 RepID=A0A2P8HS38_CHINA|nr:M28 family peptidase [Chitinophaga niastensis]PSL49023.1 peptidase M28-like protein [Chitinophaga niastensis]
MRVFITIACSLLITTAGAQVKLQKSTGAVNKSVAAKYGETITPAAVKKQLYIVAGPEMEGRETATRGQERAAAYIISQFKEAGLEPGANGNWEQHYPLYSDSLVSSTITAGDKTFQFGEDFITDLRSGHQEDIRASKIIFADYGVVAGNRNDYDNLNVSGQIVLIREGAASGASRDKGSIADKIKTAKAKEVKALLVVTPFASRYKSLDQDKLRKTGVYMQKDTTEHLNVYYITPAVAAGLLGAGNGDSLLSAIDNGWKVPVISNTAVHIVFNKAGTTLQPSNVLGYLEGTDKKEEVVFVTAHYDHLGKIKDEIYYGADDDGSGTSAVLEIAAAFARAKKAGNGPRRSMVFMTVSGEEKGLLGSTYYTTHPVYPLTNTVVDLNIDMIGRIDPAHEKDTNYVYIIGDNKLSSELRPINEKANATHTGFKLDYKYNDPNDPEGFYYRSDHYMFAQHNIPIIFYFNGTHADYHQPTDTVEKINYDLLAKRARLVFYTAWDIANRERKPVVDRHEK